MFTYVQLSVQRRAFANERLVWQGRCTHAFLYAILSKGTHKHTGAHYKQPLYAYLDMHVVFFINAYWQECMHVEAGVCMLTCVQL